MITIKQKNKKSWVAHYRELMALVLCAIIVFMGLALYSYYPEDCSWFFYTTDNYTVHNWCGILGAYSAAFLLYLLGGIGALFFLILLCFIAYMLLRGYSWRSEWERIAAFGLLVFIGAALSSLHTIIGIRGTFPGGLIGYIVCSVLITWCGRIGSALFLYTWLIIILVLVTQFSYVAIIISFRYRMRMVYHFLQRRYLYQKLGNIIKMIYIRCGWVINYGVYGIQRLCEGYDTKAVSTVENFNHEEISHDSTESIPNQAPISFKSAHVITTTSLSMNDNTQTKNEYTRPKIDSNQTGYVVPLLSYTAINDSQHDNVLRNERESRSKILEEKLKHFGVYGSVVSIKRGPVVTLFEYQPQINTKLSKIIALEDDLAMALQAVSIRIIAPIPGTSVVGFEIANTVRSDVLLARIMQSPIYQECTYALPLIVGEDIIGNSVIIDLVRMPHMLIAGSTGSGKSVALNAMLISLLCKLNPDALKLILIDPKRLEFAAYADIPHLIFPLVTDPRQAIYVLRWLVNHMEERYKKMATLGVRNISDYNAYVQQQGGESLPFIVVIIDELSDLMLTAGRDIEEVIMRLTQMARAAGIHVIVATQRPSADVITGIIKVNFPSRISFRVASKIDSRIILDCVGADKLLGSGDMLFLDANTATIKRVHGAFVSDKEINAVVNHIRAQRSALYIDTRILEPLAQQAIHEEDEALYQQVIVWLHEIDDISISLVQRTFRIGYNRAARIIELLELRGLIMPADGGKTRKIIR